MQYHPFPGNAMEQKYGPGAKAGNVLIDVNEKMIEEGRLYLIKTLEKVIKKKKLKNKENLDSVE